MNNTVNFSIDVTDQDGNRVYTENKGSSLAVMLEMKNKPAKQIAKVYNDSVQIKKDRAKHLFRRNNGYGFNRLLFNNLPEQVKTLILTDGVGYYEIPIAEVLNSPDTINFDLQGYEPQILVSLNLIEKFKA